MLESYRRGIAEKVESINNVKFLKIIYSFVSKIEGEVNKDK